MKVPVAVNCCVCPVAIDGFAGVTAIDCNVAAVTVNIVEPVTPLNVALIVDVPDRHRCRQARRGDRRERRRALTPTSPDS